LWVGLSGDSRIDLLVLGVTLCPTAVYSLFAGFSSSRSCADDLGVPEDSTTIFRSL